MAATPVEIVTRPFAIEPITNIMLPDGIFDNAIYSLRIAAHFTNTSGAELTDLKVYLESVGDPGIVPTARTFTFARIPAGASVLVTWDADFRNATPGKRLVSFVAQADGFEQRRSIVQIFVSQTRYDSTTDSYTCEVEEGTLTVSNLQAIMPRRTWRKDDEHRDREDCSCRPLWGPNVLTGLTAVWEPNPPYAGEHGDLPFSDPWWKVLAVIVAIIAAIVAIIAAATGGGTAAFGASGKFDETDPSVECCTPDVDAGPERDYTVAGVASAIATGAAAVALSDAADPWWRGQEATSPDRGELTVGETVEAAWTLSQPPAAGVAYAVDVQWTYTRQTTGGSSNHSVTETQVNVHVSEGIQVESPAKVSAFDPLWVRARFSRSGDKLYSGTDLYAFALFRSPGGLYFVVSLSDDGLDYDPEADDGVYAGWLNLERAYRRLLRYDLDVLGDWHVYIFAQDVNKAPPGAKPEIAAQQIGGFFVASALSIAFDPSLPCPLRADAVITVA